MIDKKKGCRNNLHLAIGVVPICAWCGVSLEWDFYKTDGSFTGTGDFYGRGVEIESAQSEPNESDELTWSCTEAFAKPNPDSEFGKSFANEKRYVHKITKG